MGTAPTLQQRPVERLEGFSGRGGIPTETGPILQVLGFRPAAKPYPMQQFKLFFLRSRYQHIRYTVLFLTGTLVILGDF